MGPRLLTTLAIALACLSALFGLMEMVMFGGRIGDTGVVQDSLFMPLTYIFALLSAVFFVLAIVRKFKK
ncbi:hypothetical protein [Marivita sp. S2033]|uniref:hypothetical protein n=1 Tax=Marivita sp. S2033 TaxID=3373187 RepID=UPI00398204FA